MKLDKRERALLLVAGALAVLVAVRFAVGNSGPAVAEAAADSVEMAEKTLLKLRQLAATVPGKPKVKAPIPPAWSSRRRVINVDGCRLALKEGFIQSPLATTETPVPRSF